MKDNHNDRGVSPVIGSVMMCAVVSILALAYIPYLSYCDDGGYVPTGTCASHWSGARSGGIAERCDLQGGEPICRHPPTRDDEGRPNCGWHPVYKSTDAGVSVGNEFMCEVGRDLKDPGCNFRENTTICATGA